jgi:DNA repair ATPase RecN
MTESRPWKYPGSRWWKVDIHTHTPASLDTTWAKANVDLTPEAWLLGFMQAGFDCVAVTDHNSGAWIDRLKNAYQGMKNAPLPGFREIHLFPGVEITVNGGFHLLAIFDQGTSTSDIDTLLGQVGYEGTKGDSDAATRKSAAEVVEAVVRAKGLPIPAHVDQAKGLLRLANPGGAGSALDANTLRQVLRCDGIVGTECVDQSIAKPGIYADEGCQWTEVLGSDIHASPSGSAGASRFAWIKMADPPSIEGLRLALLDGAGFAVRRGDADPDFDPFRRPEHCIEEIQVAEAQYMGRGGSPTTVKLSPWFNALVGGRGTGKSTVVHALRLAYRRDDDLNRLPDSEPARVFERFRKVPRHRGDNGGLTPNTDIMVTLSREGVPTRLHWRQDGGADAVEQDKDGSWVVSVGQVPTSDRFPIRIFSQGQIAALAGENQDALLALIDEVAKTRDASNALDEAKNRYYALRAQIRELDGKLGARVEIAAKLDDVKRKLGGFEGQEHAEILKAYQLRKRQEREMGRQLDGAAAAAARIEALAEELVVEDPPEGLLDQVDPIDRAALDTLTRLRDAIAKSATEALATASALRESIAQARKDQETGPWRTAIQSAEMRYAQLTGILQSQGVEDPSAYGNLVQDRQRLESEVERLDSIRAARDELDASAREQRGLVRRARQTLSNSRREFLARTLEGNDYVRIALLPYRQDARAIERSMRETLGANDDRFEEDILAFEGDQPKQGLIADLLKDLPDDAAEASSALESRLDGWGTQFLGAAGGRNEFGGHFNNFLQRECGRHPELLDRLMLFTPEDALSVEYSPRGDGRDFRSIGQASAGQRAAAMLAFLLAHGKEPMVLDQPEDDLDNHLIYDLVVRQIRENKMHRQLLVITHNANIVVNGDAEMLHVLDFRGGQCRVVQAGSLQEKDMREEVCRVMEGGREAFERRYQRLGRTR